MFAKVLYLRPNRYTSFKSPTDDRFDIDSCLSSKYRKSKCEFGADVLYNHEMKFVFLSPTDVNLYFRTHEINFLTYENSLYSHIAVAVITHIHVYSNKTSLRFTEDNSWRLDNDQEIHHIEYNVVTLDIGKG